jgi:hypothetical protein
MSPQLYLDSQGTVYRCEKIGEGWIFQSSRRNATERFVDLEINFSELTPVPEPLKTKLNFLLNLIEGED